MANNIGGYIVHDGSDLIHGIGATEEAAWADMLRTMDAAQIDVLSDDEDSDQYVSWTRASGFTTRPASAALIAAVKDRGGDLSWDIVDGIARTASMEG